MQLVEIISLAYSERMKYIGYVRPTDRHTRARQEWQLREYPLHELVADDLEDAIRLIRAGRALVVAEASVLGKSGRQIADAVSRVHAKGGYVIVASKAADSRIPADAVMMGASPRGRRKLTTDEARERAQKYTDADIEKAREHWQNPRLTMAEASEKAGMSAATLWRRLGARDMKPGRPPQRKRKT